MSSLFVKCLVLTSILAATGCTGAVDLNSFDAGPGQDGACVGPNCPEDGGPAPCPLTPAHCQKGSELNSASCSCQPVACATLCPVGATQDPTTCECQGDDAGPPACTIGCPAWSMLNPATCTCEGGPDAGPVCDPVPCPSSARWNPATCSCDVIDAGPTCTLGCVGGAVLDAATCTCVPCDGNVYCGNGWCACAPFADAGTDAMPIEGHDAG